MNILIAEDDYVSRKVLLGHLSHYGHCDATVDGIEAVNTFSASFDNKKPYDLIFLDIMMPNMDGQEALTKIRDLEAKHGVRVGDGALVVMTTALSDSHNVLKAFNGQCEAYIVKPVTREKIVSQLVDLGLLSNEEAG